MSIHYSLSDQGSKKGWIEAENDKKEFVNKYLSLICNALDILLAILLFIPAFGNGTGSSETVSLFGLTGISPWLKIVFIVIISITILNGICGMIIAHFNKTVWTRHRLVTGVGLSIQAVIVFMATRQPYAGIVCFAFLVINPDSRDTALGYHYEKCRKAA